MQSRIHSRSFVQKSGYTGFGSFHSGNVEEMIVKPDSEYVSPETLFDPTIILQETKDSKPAFGLDIKEREFMFDPEWYFLNHGAFGGCARAPYAAASHYRRRCESQPLRFFDRELLPLIVHSTRALSRVVNADYGDLVLMPNATTATNIVARNAGIGPGKNVVVLDVGYGSTRKILQRLCDDLGATLKVVDTSLVACLENEEMFDEGALLEKITSAIDTSTCLLVVDHVTSNTALKLPVKRIASRCRKLGTLCLVDGAHGLLQFDLDLKDIGADMYLGNCHKWYSNARGSGFLWVKEASLRESMTPLIISHGSGSGFVSDYAWDGCRDYSAYLSLPTAIQFWETVGVTASRDYIHSLKTYALQTLGLYSQLLSSGLLLPR